MSWYIVRVLGVRTPLDPSVPTSPRSCACMPDAVQEDDIKERLVDGPVRRDDIDSREDHWPALIELFLTRVMSSVVHVRRIPFDYSIIFDIYLLPPCSYSRASISLSLLCIPPSACTMRIGMDVLSFDCVADGLIGKKRRSPGGIHVGLGGTTIGIGVIESAASSNMRYGGEDVPIQHDFPSVMRGELVVESHAGIQWDSITV